jgi:CBS domain-containing protein
VAELLPENDERLIIANWDDKVADVLRRLSDNKILSVPIYNRNVQRYTSYIDLVDILVHALNVFDKSSSTGLTYALENLLKLSDFADAHVGTLADISKRNPFQAVESSMSLYDCLNLMTKWKVHRVPVVDSMGTLLTSISQSSIVKFLCRIISKFSVAEKTVEELKLGYKTIVHSIRDDKPLRDAFTLMRDQGVMGLPVVDQNGAVVESVSVSDLKQIGFDGSLFSKLDVGIKDVFKNYQRQGPYLVTPKQTVAEVAGLLTRAKVHRVFLVDENKKPIGVISLGDILELINKTIH